MEPSQLNLTALSKPRLQKYDFCNTSPDIFNHSTSHQKSEKYRLMPMIAIKKKELPYDGIL